MTEPGGYNASIIAEFRANHGQVGGNFAGAPLLLLHTTGARTGTPRVNPVMYLPHERTQARSALERANLACLARFVMEAG